ncbi:MAG TPA: hypothetical protein PLH37_00915 [bacterium]|nr:hypothetical protein [bacterium]
MRFKIFLGLIFFSSIINAAEIVGPVVVGDYPYVMKYGDTWQTVAARAGVSPEFLERYNGSGRIFIVGDRILIPVFFDNIKIKTQESRFTAQTQTGNGTIFGFDGDGCAWQPMKSGLMMDPNKFFIASPFLPMHTKVLVELLDKFGNPVNSIETVVLDLGPDVEKYPDRIADLSYGLALHMGGEDLIRCGKFPVRITVLK